jgi:hypothetical protein
VRATRDASRIEIRLDDARRGHEAGVTRHRSGHPVDVRGLECGDLAEGVAVELPELDDPGACEVQ